MITTERFSKRRIWVIGGVVFVVVLLGLYIWWSVRSWQRYDSVWHEVQVAVKQDVDEATKSTPASEKEYSQKRTALRKLASTLEKHSDMCKANAFTGWQKVLHAVEASAKQCEETLAKHAELKSSLVELVGFLDDEQALQKELVKLIPSKMDSLNEKQWSTYATAATTVQKQIGGLKLGDQYASVMPIAQKQLTTLVAKWKAFNEAHQKKDRTAWEKAKGELVQAYAGMPAIADASEKELETLLKRLDTARDTL